MSLENPNQNSSEISPAVSPSPLTNTEGAENVDAKGNIRRRREVNGIIYYESDEEYAKRMQEERER